MQVCELSVIRAIFRSVVPTLLLGLLNLFLIMLANGWMNIFDTSLSTTSWLSA